MTGYSDTFSQDPRRHAPATERNREPILAVLKTLITGPATILEIASGTGQHAVWFAGRLPDVTWIPSDADEEMRASVAAWARREKVRNIALPPRVIDARARRWNMESVDGVYCANMIHISPYSACEGLIKGAGACVRPGGFLMLYGPYKVEGEHTAPSNASFDETLRSQNADWGIRDLEAVTALAEAAGFEPEEPVEMPANNLSVIFRKL
ncbi:DUF938 domain-containing protein [Alphaproteobacteria bacterium HT1-32]|nr:DUF938 domain-containing protein [Alphaproteobacteria bacterium HT1-32]